MRTVRPLTAVALAALAYAVPAAANTTVFSEDFSAGFGVFTHTGAADVVTGAPGYAICCGATGTAANLANPFVTFGSGERASGSIRTTFGLVQGKQYQLKFDAAVLGGGEGILLVGPIVDSAAIVNQAAFGIHQNADNNFDTTFKSYSYTFNALHSGLSSINFSQIGNGSGVDVAIDNVSLTALGVPEPANWALLISGFGLTGAALRRRTRRLLAVA